MNEKELEKKVEELVRERFRQIARKGWEAYVQKYGREKLSENGKKGVAALREKYGPNYWREIANKPRKKKKDSD